MKETRSVAVGDLRLIVTDPTELAKGTQIADKGGISHLSRHEHKLFADAAGSGASPYKVQIIFGEDNKITGRCSCMAARSRPYCKHSAALLVAWARSPEAFAVADVPPPPPPGERPARTASVKKGKVDPTELKKKGVEQAFTLLSELWQTGVVAIAEDRASQVADLASSLRELGLRRLAARTLELAALLELAAKRDGSFSAEAYAELFSDMWLTIRKLEKHLEGEALADEHVEELIGRTWTKKDRKPIENLDLVEYAFLQRTTPDGFILRESRFLDIASGDHFTEKQILPAMLAKRIPAKPSYRGRRLPGANGTLFPSFAPRRIDLVSPGELRDLDDASIRAATERALPSMARALAVLAERRRDPFAPPNVPVLVRVDGVMPSVDRVRLIDGEGGTLFLAGGRPDEDALMTALSGLRVAAVFGDITLEGALPSLLALAVVGEKDGKLTLVPLGGDDASARAEERNAAPSPSSWAAAAKRAKVAGAATMLGEVRDDLSTGFQDGVQACVSPRFLAPLSSRLTELSMTKQAEALDAIGKAAEPIAALDTMVKVHQVLGIALSRLAAAAPVDPSTLVRIPLMPSVAIPKPSVLMTPEVAVAKEATGELHRWERAYHVSIHYESSSPQLLLEGTDRFWGDGFAAPFVVAAVPTNPTLAAKGAILLLSEGSARGAWGPPAARLAKLTAIEVLAAVGTPEARARLASLADDLLRNEGGLASHATRALSGPRIPAEQLHDMMSLVVAGASKEDRAHAIERLAAMASLEAIGVIRTALRDRTAYVRKAAAYALASLGDTASLDTFVAWLEGHDHDQAKVGAHAIGYLGDLRGAGAVLSALARGFSPVVVREALVLLGPWVLGPLLDLVETQPEMAKRASVSSLVKSYPSESTASTVLGWIEAARGDAGKLARRALFGLEICSGRADTVRFLVERITERHHDIVEGEDADARALKKKLSAIEKKMAKKATAAN